MRCENCKREIGIEELKCPYCGADNPFAEKHEQNMQEYKKRYDKTGRDVIDSAKKTGKLSKKASVIVVLILAIIVMMMIAANNYADHDYSEKEKKEANKNPEENMAIIDSLLENGEYTECDSFIRSHSIMDYDAEEYNDLHGFAYLLDDYTECIQYFEQLICCAYGEDYWDYIDLYNSHFCTYIDSFYEAYETRLDSPSCAKYREEMIDMEYDLRTAMMVYFNMTEEDVEEFISLSEGQKMVKLEEILGIGEENDNEE